MSERPEVAQRAMNPFPWSGVLALALLLASAPLVAQEDPAPIQRVRDHAASVLWFVELRFKRQDRTREDRSQDGPQDVESRINPYAEYEASLPLSGVLVDSAGVILVPDPQVPRERVESVTVVSPSGERYPGRLWGLVRHHHGLLVSFDPPEGAAPWAACEFVAPGLEGAPGAFDGTVYLASLGLSGDDPSLLVRGERLHATMVLEGGRVLDGFPDGPDISSHRFMTCWLVYDEAARPLGVTLSPRLWRDPDGRSSWLGAGAVLDERVGFDAVDEALGRAERALLDSACEVEVRFRRDAETEEALSRLGPLVGTTPRGSGQPASRVHLYGLSMGEGRLLVIADLDPVHVRAIERLVVKVPGPEGDPVEVPGRFVGLFARFGGFLVEYAPPEGGAPRAGPPAAASPPDGELLLSLALRHRFGGPDVEKGYTRLDGSARGYRDARYRAVLGSLPEGALLVDLDGAWVGVHTREKRYGRPVNPEEVAMGGYRYRSSPSDPDRLFEWDEVWRQVVSPEGFLEPDVVPQSKEESRRRVWFGVEFQAIGPDLATALKVAGPTRDGRLGLLVDAVYAGSPAARLGVQRGDILLAFGEKDSTPVDLVLPPDYAARSYYRWAWRGGRSGSEPRRLWPERKTFLTELLTRMGAGKAVSLRWLSAGEEKGADLVLEQAPPDYSSAPEVEEEATGLTVKDLTYEVRHVLALADTSPGVVVAKVETGSGAEVGGVRPFELVTAVEREPVADSAAFEAAIAARMAAGRRTTELTVVLLGKSRFVDVTLGRVAGE
ncbi:MAG: hypothetical protein HY722_09450 [Planctomycetes bacterium]|nr:hypothetical protein [Planctomycetota bacterium]